MFLLLMLKNLMPNPSEFKSSNIPWKNVTLVLEHMGRVPHHIRGRVAGCWMQGSGSEKLPISLGLTPKQYADGGMDFILLER